MIATRYRETCLIETNLRWLQQMIDFLERLGGDLYMQPVASLGGQAIGPQFRHVIDFYDAFLAGLSQRRIDYTARKRDRVIESSRLAALDRLRGLRSKFAIGGTSLGDRVVWVRVEDSPAETYVMSSAYRELQELSSHTVHHLAIVAMIARTLGAEVNPGLGVSPSTLTHRKSAA